MSNRDVAEQGEHLAWLAINQNLNSSESLIQYYHKSVRALRWMEDGRTRNAEIGHWWRWMVSQWLPSSSSCINISQERWGNVFFGIRRYFEQICNFIKSSLPSIELDAGGAPMMAQDGIERTLWGRSRRTRCTEWFICMLRDTLSVVITPPLLRLSCKGLGKGSALPS